MNNNLIIDQQKGPDDQGNQDEKKENKPEVNNENSKLMGELSSVIDHIDNLNKYYTQLCEKENKLRVAIQNQQFNQQRYHFLHYNVADNAGSYPAGIPQPNAFLQLTHHMLPQLPTKHQPNQIQTQHHPNLSIQSNLPGPIFSGPHTRNQSELPQQQQQQQPQISIAHQKMLQEKDAEIQSLRFELQKITKFDNEQYQKLQEEHLLENQQKDKMIKDLELQYVERQKAMQQQLEMNYQKRIQELERQIQLEKNKHDEFIAQKYKKLEDNIKDLIEEADIHKNKSLSLEKLLRNNPDKAQFENELRKLQTVIVQQNHELEALRTRLAQQQQMPMLQQTGHNLVISQNYNQLFSEIERLKIENDQLKFNQEDQRIKQQDKEREIELLKQYNKSFQPKAILESENDVMRMQIDALKKELEGLKILIIKKTSNNASAGNQQQVIFNEHDESNEEEKVRELVLQNSNDARKHNEEKNILLEEENEKLRFILKEKLQEIYQLQQKTGNLQIVGSGNNEQLQIAQDLNNSPAQKLPTQLSERCDYLENYNTQLKQQKDQAIQQRVVLEQEVRKLQNALEVKLHETEALKTRLNTIDGNADAQDNQIYRMLKDTQGDREMLGNELVRMKLAFENKMKECEALRGKAALQAGDNSGLEKQLQEAESHNFQLKNELTRVLRETEARILQMQGEMQATRKDADQKCALLQGELQRVTITLRDKINETDLLKGHAMKLEGSYKENVNNIERVFRENQNKSKVVTTELEKVTAVLREKMKESDELRATLTHFENLMREKAQHNEELAKKCQTLVLALNDRQNSEQRVQEMQNKCQALMMDLERVTVVLKEKAQQNDELLRKCQQLSQALNDRMNGEAKLIEYEKKCQILTIELEKITGALKDKLREIDMMKVNFARVEQYVKERDLIEQEMRRMKELLQIKVQECEEWKLKCRDMDGRLQRAAQLEEKFRQQENKLRFLMTQIRDLPNKVQDNF